MNSAPLVKMSFLVAAFPGSLPMMKMMTMAMIMMIMLLDIVWTDDNMMAGQLGQQQPWEGLTVAVVVVVEAACSTSRMILFFWIAAPIRVITSS